MNKRCIVNFVTNTGWYPRGQARLAAQCERFGVDFLPFQDDCPVPTYAPHSLVPYAFKCAAVEAALNRGYETVCWMDASANIQHHPGPIFDVAESLGAFVSMNYGILTGKWSTDQCLVEFGLTRQEAWAIEHCSALVCAFCPSHPVGKLLWDEYSAAARKGTALVGPHNAKDAPGMFNKWDPTGVEGHRHDQTVLSILAAKHGIKLQPHEMGLDYGRERPNAIVAAYPAE